MFHPTQKSKLLTAVDFIIIVNIIVITQYC